MDSLAAAVFRAAKVARYFYKKYPVELLPPETYENQPHHEVDIEWLTKAVSKDTGINVTVWNKRRKPKGVLDSFLLRLGERADIQVYREHRHCWKRYLTIKELSHLLLDDSPSQYTDDVETLVRGLVAEIEPAEEALAYESEKVAYFVACELLVPWQAQDKITELIENGWDDLQIATYFSVPQSVIATRHHTDYYAACVEANKRLT